MPNVTVVGQELVDLDTPAGFARFKEINAQAIAGGYEGIMLKEPDAPYECKRTVSWLKIKPFIEVSLVAVAIEEGTGKNAGRMGAVLFEGEDDGKFISVSVGGGWSDKDRDYIWNHQDEILHQIGEVRADAATKNQDSENVWSLRFPRFKTWRGFVAGEKL
jgi:DNA ligase-1